MKFGSILPAFLIAIYRSTKKKIANNEINYLNFIFTDEYNNPLLDINEWLLTLTIIIQKKQYQPVPMLME